MTVALITGSDGFIGRNLTVRLAEAGGVECRSFTRDNDLADLAALIDGVDIVFHCAGANRPPADDGFVSDNVDLTDALAKSIEATGRAIPVVFTSSAKSIEDTPYGRSKRAAEERLEKLHRDTGSPVVIFRLCNVFGKWSRPDYNSAVATFCANTAIGKPHTVHDPDAALQLVYIDDVVDAFARLAAEPPTGLTYPDGGPVYRTTVGKVSRLIEGFAHDREAMLAPSSESGLERALYATYISFLPPEAFAYSVPIHADPRGDFVEMLKTPGHGQFSYFTSKPGVVRGEHYHHSKVEKFLVISGRARFGFRHIGTGETVSIDVEGGEGRVVETIPGWTHNVANIGDGELVAMLWASEIFDRDRPDTHAAKVDAG